jgi:hypothetical protein
VQASLPACDHQIPVGPRDHLLDVGHHVHDTRIPWDEIYVDNVPVLTPARMLALLQSLEAHLDPTGVMLLAEHARTSSAPKPERGIVLEPLLINH